MRFLLPGMFSVITLFVTPHTDAAAPTVDHLFPAGGQVGTTVTVKLIGKLDAKTNAWCSRSDVKLLLNTKSRTLKLTIPQKTPPGGCWLRLYNAEGASPPKAFLIGTLPEVTETEPNNSLGESQPLKSSSVVNGVLSKSGDVDTSAVSLKTGQTLVASMTANNALGSPMDGVLQIVSKRGFVLAQNDDDRGFDPQIAFNAPRDGVYHIRCFAFPSKPNSSVRLAGAASYIYRLTITTGPVLDHPYPLAVSRGAKQTVQLRGWNLPKASTNVAIAASGPEDFVGVYRAEIANVGRVRVIPHATGVEREPDSLAKPQAVEFPSTITGHIGRRHDVDVYRVAAKKGDRLRFRVEARSLGSPLDPVLKLLDAKGAEVARAETRSSTAIDETLTYRVTTDGPYRLAVTDLHRRGGWRYVYRLTFGELPVESLRVAADRFALPKGKPLVIPVTVSGSVDAGNLAFAIRGLPKRVSFKTSPGKTTPARRGRAATQTVQLTLTAKSPFAFSGPIQIVAAGKEESPLEHRAETTVEGAGRSTSDLWLTVSTKPVATKTKKKK
ncbi:MAG: PPC domain-containing protein [Planctomycetaceae bacterium]